MLTGMLQPSHPLLILIVALLIIGPKKLLAAGRALGQGLSEFKRSINGAGGPDTQAVCSPVPSVDEGRSQSRSTPPTIEAPKAP
jgi:sec-independent protein translocase protein TatA